MLNNILDFVKAALPWVAIGIAIIILCVNHNENKEVQSHKPTAEKELDKKNKKDNENYMNEGMCIGMCIGSALGAIGIFNTGTGLCVGMCLGLAIGSEIKK